MKHSSTERIMNLAGSPAGRCGRELVSRRRLWRLIDRLNDAPQAHTSVPPDRDSLQPPPGAAAALVLHEAPEPYAVLWEGPSNPDAFHCECGSNTACAHLAALLFTLARKHPEIEVLKNFISTLRVTQNTVIQESVLDPEEDLLFFKIPDPVEYRQVLILGERSTMAAGYLSSAEIPAGTLRDMSGKEWCLVPALAPLRNDGSTGSPKPWKPGIAKRPVLPESFLPGTQGSAAVSALDGLLRKNGTVLTPEGRSWNYKRANRLCLSFQPLLASNTDDALFEPMVSLESGRESVEGSLFADGDIFLLLDYQTAKARSIKDSNKLGWFFRLLFSRRVLSSSDIRARFNNRRSIPDSIKIILPRSPESLPLLFPSLVLEAKERSGTTELTPHWRYKTVLLDPANRSDTVVDSRGRHPRPLGIRNKKAESELFSQAENILGSSLSWRRGHYASLAGDSSIPMRLEMDLGELLSKYGNALLKLGVELRLENRPIRFSGTLNVSARKTGKLLEMKTEVVDSESEFYDTLELDSWFSRRALVRSSQAYFTLTEKALEQLSFLRTQGMDSQGFLRTSPDNLSLIDAVYTELKINDDEGLDFRKKRDLYLSLRNFSSDSAPAVPDFFRTTLRPYQFHGYAWLLHLHKNKLGACLADDMGLGKTVQTLAYICRLKESGHFGPSLLVGPVVTLGNWEAEIKRFASQITVYRYSGPAGKRKLPSPDEPTDLIIVSYQTLRNDAEIFLRRSWNHVILDEAHYVKNASSQTFKTVRSIDAGHRISLTGTPLENHLGELWSQMSFLNPGLLGSRHDFRSRYVKPVERGDDAQALTRLSDLVAPFILRRRKADVLHELPPKDETVIHCDMSDDQAAAYHAVRNIYLQQVQGMLSNKGLNESRIQIFTLISKLRLLAIYPPLAGEQFSNISSGKMMLLDNLLDGILEEDHKVLVFSQFLGALDKVQSVCNQRSWPFSRLTGATKNREEQINRFQNKQNIRIFLLSLRAGGVGINLTAADYVILLDPWWNPAVEAQAIDRAHRMGQRKPVMAYRLISNDTIEEKVLEMQESKKQLISGVLGETELPRLSETEILNLFQ